MSHPQLKPITLPAAALATLCAALWGGLAVAIRFTQDDLPPIGTAGLRFAIGSLFIFLWARWRGAPLAIGRGQGPPISMIGLLLFVQIGLFHWGLTMTNSAHGSVLIGSHPVLVTLIAHFVLPGDRLSWNKVVGLAVAVCGLVVLVTGGTDAGASHTAPRDAATMLGDAVVLASSFLLATKTVLTKQVLQRVEVAKLLLWSNLLATGLFLAWSGAFEGLDRFHFTLGAVAGLVYQGVAVAGFCFLAWTVLLEHHRASQLAVFTFAQPLCGVLFGVWLRGDLLTAGLAAGGAAVAAGIVLVVRGGRAGGA